MAGGGYRQPSHPAPVSGPGSKSRRTDGGPAQKIRNLPDAAYGENAVYRDLQEQAPLAQTPGPADQRVRQAPRPAPTPLTAPTANPAEPVTAGADAGAGPDSSALGLRPNAGAAQLGDILSQLAPYDHTGAIAALMMRANQGNV